jgi:hypothetical protein
VDIGVGSFTVAAGLDVTAVRGLLVEGRGDGSFSFSFAAPGDTNLDAAVDILDAANVLAGGAYDTGVAASWSQGDTTYDGVVDILDIADFLGTALYDQPPYRAAAAPEASTPTARGTLPSAGPAAPLRSSRDRAFAAWAGDAAASADGATAPRRRAARLR